MRRTSAIALARESKSQQRGADAPEQLRPQLWGQAQKRKREETSRERILLERSVVWVLRAAP